MRGATSIGFLIVAVLVGAVPPAAAESRLPKTRLVADGHRQRGIPDISWCWGERESCHGQTGPIWGGAVRAAAGVQARIRLLEPERPNKIRLRGWREFECGIDSCPGTEGHRVYNLGLRRIRREGNLIGWKALFNLNDRPGDLYLLLRGRWDAHHYAFWTFHLDLR